MFMKIAAALLVSIVASARLVAQTPAKSSADTAIAPGRLAAAEELLEVTDTEKGIRDGMRAYFEVQGQQNPGMAPYFPTLMEFSQKYLVWRDIKPRLARIYAQALTEDELRAAIAFQRTPAGRAFTAHQMDVQRAIMQVVQETLQVHAFELQQMIQARAAELNKPSTPPSKKPR
jgi:hypothetical protein